MCLPDLENRTISIPIFCLISHSSIYLFRKKSTQFWPKLDAFYNIWPKIHPISLLDRCLKLYTTLWNIWTYQQLCKKNTQVVYNFTQIVYNFTQVVYFFTQLLVGSYVSQCCVNFLNSGLTVCNLGSFISDGKPPDRYTKFCEKAPQKAGTYVGLYHVSVPGPQILPQISHFHKNRSFSRILATF